MSLRNGPRAAPMIQGRFAVAMLTGIGLILLLAGVLALPSSPTADVGTVPPLAASSPRAASSASAVPSPRAASSASAAPAGSRAARPFPPLRVQVPAGGVDARVVPVDVGREGTLAVPPDVRQVGWWRAGAAAGSTRGTVVLVGHVDSAEQGRGALFPLRRLGPGDRVVVTGTRGERVVYVVSARRQYPKTSLPRAEVFGQGTAPRLVLLTCGGPFDAATRHYRDNVVVYATPVTR